ncbi:MAG: hypothetical protein WC119_12015 [Synergistaceae bacterium]
MVICIHCGYHWTPRVETPKTCPGCKSRDWDGQGYSRTKPTVDRESIENENLREFVQQNPNCLIISKALLTDDDIKNACGAGAYIMRYKKLNLLCIDKSDLELFEGKCPLAVECSNGVVWLG